MQMVMRIKRIMKVIIMINTIIIMLMLVMKIMMVVLMLRMTVTGWPNARNVFIIFNATCQCSCAPGSWCARRGPNAHALAQQCCANVAKRVQHHATSKIVHEKFDLCEL